MKYLSLITFILGLFIGWFIHTGQKVEVPAQDSDVIVEAENVNNGEKPRVRNAPFVDSDSFNSYHNYNYTLTLFDSYDAALHASNFGPKNDDDNIPWMDEKEEMLQKFTSLAPHYLPYNLINSVEEFDVTGDKVPEKIIFYSCFGCNAPSRNVDIISGSKLIFSAEGANLTLKPLENNSGFELSNLLMPRGAGYTVITFIPNSDGEFHSVKEEDIYYDNKYQDQL